MNMMITASLLINIAVLIPVCTGLFTNAAWASEAYGIGTPARGILLSVYMAILILSVALLVLRDPKLVAALLAVQIVYKLLTPMILGGFGNPVVVSNVIIAAFHSVTLFVIWRA